jgi:hypothetical protein
MSPCGPGSDRAPPGECGRSDESRCPPSSAADAVIVDLEVGHEAQRGLGEAIRMPVAGDPLLKEWLTAEQALGEARDQLRTFEHLDLWHREEAWQAYRLALDVFNCDNQ